MALLIGAVCFVVCQIVAADLDDAGSSTASNVSSQISALEQSVANMQTLMQTSTSQVTTVLGKLAMTEDELVAVKTELRTTQTDLHAIQSEVKMTKNEVLPLKTRLAAAEAELAALKNDTHQRPSNSELAAMIVDLDHLKSASQSPQSSINLTAIDHIGNDVKRNVKDIAYLKSELLSVHKNMNQTKHDLEVNGQDQKNLKGEFINFSTNFNKTRDMVEALDHEVHQHAKMMNTSEFLLAKNGDEVKKAQGDIKSLKIQGVNNEAQLHAAVGNSSLTTARLQTTMNGLETNMASFASSVSKLGQENDLASQEIKSLKSTLVDTKVEVGTATSKLTSLRTEVQLKLNALAATVASLNSTSVTVGHSVTSVAFQASPASETFGWTILKFDAVAYNQGGGYDPTTGYFTAPVSGTYLFWTSVLLRGPSANVYINKGSERLAAGFGLTAAAYNSGTASAMAVTHVKAGEMIHFFLDSTGDTVHNAMESLIGGALLHASN